MSEGEVTVQDLSGLSPDLRYDLIDGHLLVGSRTPLDQDVAMKILRAVDDACGPDLLAVHSLSLSFDECNEFRPAVVVIDPCRGNAHRSPVPLADAVLVVDLLLPHEQLEDLAPKSAIYAASGLRHWWIAGPQPDDAIAITENQLSDGSYKIVQHATSTFAATEPFPVTVDLAALSLRRRKVLQRVRPIE